MSGEPRSSFFDPKLYCTQRGLCRPQVKICDPGRFPGLPGAVRYSSCVSHMVAHAICPRVQILYLRFRQDTCLAVHPMLFN